MNIFENLFILGRPASGKSEFLDFMSKLSAAKRAERFHIGKMKVVDDFVWLWEKFEEDNLWEKVRGKRLHSKRAGNGYILESADLFDFLMEKVNAEVCEKYLSNNSFYADHTLLIEFARGGERPYSEALKRLWPEIYKRSAILYVEVSGEESIRRNDARYREKLKHTVLAHKCPDEDMQRFYKQDDWPKLTGKKASGYLKLQGVSVPFVTMLNEPESTDPSVLGPRYGDALERLWELLNDAMPPESA
ncbi:MAG: hypothetical protein ABH871_00680 [Pseudomonadota bacterium]|nr:hypothetical protein [Patescibacteria group bacterium]